MNPARLLVPALRWERDTGFDRERAVIDRSLDLGVGGFIIFGGRADAVQQLAAELRRDSSVPLLIGADLERGAGQQFAGATSLPPLAAFGAVDDVGATRAAAGLTAREALEIGVNWIYAPVADVDLEPANPIVGTRAFGTAAAHVARHVAAWIGACQAEGALACVKHFPGHGRTTEDSHATLPRVTADGSALDVDRAPFRAALDAGVASVMTAHVVYDALDARAPATLSPAIVTRLLRDELGYDGLVVTDALVMAGVTAAAGTAAAAGVAALAAGCDALLYPDDVAAAAHALTAAVGNEIGEDMVAAAIRRIDTAIERLRPRQHVQLGRHEDAIWARALGVRSIVDVRGDAAPAQSFELLTVDDDAGAGAAPADRPFAALLRAEGLVVREVDMPTGADVPLLIAVYSEVRAWKGRAGLSSEALRRVAAGAAAAPAATTVVFGHPRLAAGLPGGRVLAAWGGDTVMQHAMADWIAAQAAP